MRRMIVGAIAAICLWPVVLQAEVISFTILERTPAFADRSFGDVGPYERITAHATIALDPSDDRNAVITDLALAPRNPDGKIEAIADVVILRPADPTLATARCCWMCQIAAASLHRNCSTMPRSPAPTMRKDPRMPASASCTARVLRWSGSAGRATSPPSPASSR